MARQPDDAEPAKIIPPDSASSNLDKSNMDKARMDTPNMNKSRGSTNTSSTSSKSKTTTGRKNPDATIIDIDEEPRRVRKYLKPLMFGLLVGLVISVAIGLTPGMTWSQGFDLSKLWSRVTGFTPVEMPAVSQSGKNDEVDSQPLDTSADAGAIVSSDVITEEADAVAAPPASPNSPADIPTGGGAEVPSSFTVLTPSPDLLAELPPTALSAILISGQPLAPYWTELENTVTAINPAAVNLLSRIALAKQTGIRSTSSLMTQVSIWADTVSNNSDSSQSSLQPLSNRFRASPADSKKDEMLDTGLPEWLDGLVNSLITVRSKQNETDAFDVDDTQGVADDISPDVVKDVLRTPHMEFVQTVAMGRMDAAVLAYLNLDAAAREDLSAWYGDAQRNVAAQQLAAILLTYASALSSGANPNDGGQ